MLERVNAPNSSVYAVFGVHVALISARTDFETSSRATSQSVADDAYLTLHVDPVTRRNANRS